MKSKRSLPALLVLSLTLAACQPRALTPPASPSSPTPQPSPTPTVPWWLAPRPREMEAYGFVYDPQATPRIPPGSSRSFPIWGTELPARPIDGEPLLISSQPPASLSDPRPLLREAECQVDAYGSVTCPPGSPLAALGCESIGLPSDATPELGAERTPLGICYAVPPDEEQPAPDYLYRAGCAFRRNAAPIFKTADGYALLRTLGELRDFFAPIESPQEALTYAQLATGLQARFSFEPDPSLLYFQDILQGTQVDPVEDGYRINLFHFQTCFCEPWVNSQVALLVETSGEVTWLGALPLSMTTGFSCAD
jgi:hypothetical protein